jgi:glycosyltransferase involved in cell wall biosynthesis
VVVSYNRERLIEAVLRSVQFCDEVILIDKSSTDATRSIAIHLCDRVLQVPWSPTVEETRRFAVAQASNDWVVLLDDDEILNLAAVAWIEEELRAPRSQIYSIPLRHYIMGSHDPNAYYWPEQHIRFFNKHAVSFSSTVHGGIQTGTHSIQSIDIATGVAIEHLSHPDVATWIAKSNSYTSRPDRIRPNLGSTDLVIFAIERLSYWIQRSRIHASGDYPQAAALLRTVYDLIDGLKVWEEARGLNGTTLFDERARELAGQHLAARADKRTRRGAFQSVLTEDVAADAQERRDSDADSNLRGTG